MYDFMEYVMFTFFGCLGLCLLSGATFMAIEGVQTFRAREAVFECEARNLQPVRMTFSTRVACRARNLGSDTLNVKTIR